MEYKQRADGEWFKISKPKGHVLACCDCGLVHFVVVRTRNSGRIVEMAATRWPQQTKLRREQLSKEKPASR